MTFTFPLALLGLIGIPVLVGVYVLRNRYRHQPVSSLFLWEVHRQTQEGGAKVTRLQTPWTLLLELLILLALVLAAVDPRWQRQVRETDLAVVLDASASMAPFREQAEKRVRSIVGGSSFVNLRLLAAGPRPIRLGNSADPSDLDTLLDEWRCEAPEADLGAALALATELSGSQGRILVVSDHLQEALLPDDGARSRLRYLAVGEPAANLGIINAGRTRHDPADRAFVEVANFGGAPKTIELRAGETTTALTIPGGQTARHVMEVPHEEAALRVQIPEDLLAADNEVVLRRPEPTEVKVQIRCRDGQVKGLVERGFAAIGHQSFGSVKPDLIIADQPVPDLQNPDRWVLEIFPDADAQAFPGPFVLDRAHPLTEGLDLLGCIWGAAPTNRTALPPVVALDRTVLLGAAPPRLRLHLNPRLSTVQETPNWPILIQNLRDWRAASLPGVSQHNLRAGGEVVVRTARDVEALTWTHPDGTEEEMPVRGMRARLQPEGLGLHQVQAGEDTFSFAVNLLRPEESDLRGATSREIGRWEDAASVQREYTSSAWIWLLLALGLLCVHPFVARR